MRAIAIDTSAYAGFKRGDPAVQAVVRHAPEIHLNATVLGELLAGFAAGSRETENRSELALFIASPRVRLVPCGAETADYYALIYADLRRQGRPIPTNDMWIAASCMEHGAALLTLDAHFRYVGGLRSGAALDEFLP
jgi:predicted nucleic acid-binding protein